MFCNVLHEIKLKMSHRKQILFRKRFIFVHTKEHEPKPNQNFKQLNQIYQISLIYKFLKLCNIFTSWLGPRILGNIPGRKSGPIYALDIRNLHEENFHSSISSTFQFVYKLITINYVNIFFSKSLDYSRTDQQKFTPNEIFYNFKHSFQKLMGFENVVRLMVLQNIS